MTLSVRVHRSLSEIPQTQWEELTASEPTPVFDWSWLNLLETAGGLANHGWTPLHLALWRGKELVAAAPLYGRTDSWGDFVYDFAFAEAAPRMGTSWYPKLVGMCPATPSVGWRVFIRAGEDREDLEAQWFAAADALAAQIGAVSLQANFTDPLWSDDLPGPWRRWSHQHFLWTNQGYADFEGYLGAFDKNQRRNIRRERLSLADQGLTQRIVPGEEIPEAWFGLMGQLYDRTNDQFGPWAAKFLQPGFFEALGAIRHLLSFSATFLKDDPLPMALGFLLRKNGRMVGRYWGEREHFSDQYFNVCYYGPIEEAIRLGYHDFDPGAGSELKVRRGFRSERNVSLHRFYDPAAERLFGTVLARMNRQEEARIAALNAAIPFKTGS